MIRCMDKAAGGRGRLQNGEGCHRREGQPLAAPPGGAAQVYGGQGGTLHVQEGCPP